MSRLSGNYYIDGNFTAKSQTFPAQSVPATALAPGATGSYAPVTISQKQHRPKYSQPNTTATSVTQALYSVYGATGTVVDFRAGSIVANVGAATITVDLLKNGASILSAPITLSSSTTARTKVSATITSAGAVAGDWFDILVTTTVSTGTLATGIFCEMTINEDPQ